MLPSSRSSVKSRLTVLMFCSLRNFNRGALLKVVIWTWRLPYGLIKRREITGRVTSRSRSSSSVPSSTAASSSTSSSLLRTMAVSASTTRTVAKQAKVMKLSVRFKDQVDGWQLRCFLHRRRFTRIPKDLSWTNYHEEERWFQCES